MISEGYGFLLTVNSHVLLTDWWYQNCVLTLLLQRILTMCVHAKSL